MIHICFCHKNVDSLKNINEERVKVETQFKCNKLSLNLKTNFVFLLNRNQKNVEHMYQDKQRGYRECKTHNISRSLY